MQFVLFFACLTFVAATAGFFHVQFAREPIARSRQVSKILIGFGLLIVGASLAMIDRNPELAGQWESER